MISLNLKIAYRLDDIKKIRQGEFPFPRSLTIYPSEVCNLNCVGCNSKGIHKKDAFIDMGIFYRLIDDFYLSGGKAVALEGGGEPMLHPHLDKIINFLVSKELKIGIITNGTIIKDEMFLVDWIRISINNSMHIPEIVIDNLEKMLNRRKITRIGIKLLRSKFCPEPLCFLEADYIQIKDLRNHPDSLKENPKHIKPCGLTPLRAVVDYDGTFYPCPYFYAQKNTAIGKGLLSELWGSEVHRVAINNIKNCNLYDCPFLEIDWEEIKKADLEFI
jgi:MoaA/NifB/PqqE/SkfB family radical SAM enzyme